MTPPEIMAIRPQGGAPNTPGWSLRVVPNKFPALRVEGQLNRRAEGLYDVMSGVGAHEVIIETPHADERLASLPLSAIEDLFRVFQERILDLKNDIRLKHVIIFKNHGHAAGASLRHSHSQLIATPIIPKRVAEELLGSRNYFSQKERCIFCDIIRQEIRDAIRIVYENPQFIVLAPYAAKFPFEVWILPREHFSHFENLPAPHLAHLAVTMKSVLQKLNIALQEPPYNFVIHSAPIQESSLDYYHWHIELTPKLTRVAGFEWGTGFYINPTSPEDAARFLKEISPNL